MDVDVEDPDLDRSLDSDEELEVSEDIEYIRSIGKDSQLPESNTRDEPFKFRRLQAVFDKGGLEAAHTILNENFFNSEYLDIVLDVI